VLAADAKKAGSASECSCLTLRPPYFIERLTLINCISDIVIAGGANGRPDILQMLGSNKSSIFVINIIK
jgi:hypothetical protein